MWVVNGLLSASVVVASYALAKVIGLNDAFILVEIVTRPFPVELIFVVTHENTA